MNIKKNFIKVLGKKYRLDNTTTHNIWSTQVSNLEWCERYFKIMNKHPYQDETNQYVVIGNLEHAVFESFAQKTKSQWLNKGGFHESDLEITYEIIDKIIEIELGFALENYAQFGNYIEHMIPSLKNRLRILARRQLNEAIELLKKGLSVKYITEIILPWAVERPLYSQKLHLAGRPDFIYRHKGKVIIVDLKSHNDTEDAFNHSAQHFLQLLTYSVMYEEVFNEKVSEVQIFYTKNLKTSSIKVNKALKDNAVEQILKARSFSTHEDIPPKLSGDEAHKCDYCYIRERCFATEDYEPEPDDEVTFTTRGEFE